MDQDQKNITDMFDTVELYFEHNKSVWSGGKALADAVTELATGNDAIDTAEGEQQAPTTGHAEGKTNARDLLEEKTLELADQLAALAEVKGDPNLAAGVEMTKSSLDKMPGDDLLTTARRVLKLTGDNLAALADYQVTQDDAAELDRRIKAFEPLKSAPRAAIVKRAGVTATLPQLVAANRSLLRNRIDKMMTKFRTSEPTFYAGYQAARVIIDRGQGGQPPAPPTPPTPPTPPVPPVPPVPPAPPAPPAPPPK